MNQAVRTAASYFRVTRDEQGVARRLETAVVRCTPADGRPEPTVDLVGAVHIADKSYYETLNKELTGHDAVLFEGVLVRRKHVPMPNDQNVFAVLCRGLGRRFELVYQLDHVDYARANFVHADMLVSQFKKSVRLRKESFMGVLPPPGVEREQFDSQLAGALVEMSRQIVSDLPALELKRKFVGELVTALAGAQDVFFSEGGSTILTERNKVALRVLERMLKAGKKRLAIFFGCGHLADFETQLGEQFGLRRAEERWLLAWDLAG